MITAIDKNTALVVIDLQNSIIATPVAHSIDDVLNKVNELIKAFRSNNLPIVFINVKPVNAAWLKARKEAPTPSFPNDENLYKITDKLHTTSTDIFITKHTWNAFFETSLHEKLKSRTITGIVLGGISTSIGVEGTARAASELGYNISFATDAMTDRVEEAHNNSLKNIFPRIGELGTAKDIIAKLGSSN